MKTKLLLSLLVLLGILATCEIEGPVTNKEIRTGSLSFSGCGGDEKSIDSLASVRLVGKPDGMILVQLANTEFCCGTDSVSLADSIQQDSIRIEIIDEGPYTYCFCVHDLEFTLSSLEQKDYQLCLIESEHAYSRDTFNIQFSYSPDMDTTFYADPDTSAGSSVLEYAGVDLGGCNFNMKAAETDSNPETDTIYFTQNEDSLHVFISQINDCCIGYGTQSEIRDDTLIMRINTLIREDCDCIDCYYTFNYHYGNYSGETFHYQFYIDDFKLFEGIYLPEDDLPL